MERAREPPGVEELRKDSLHVDSQKHLLEPSDYNPLPTCVPAQSPHPGVCPH
jgi:hypothetical protein